MADPTKTASDTDEEARKVAKEKYAVEGNDLSGFRGVSPEYMTYASETDKPAKHDGKKKDDKKKDEDNSDQGTTQASASSAPSQPKPPTKS